MSAAGEALERAATVALARVSLTDGVPSTEHRCPVEVAAVPVRQSARVGGEQLDDQLA